MSADILIGIVLNLQISFREDGHLSDTESSIHEHGMSLHLFRSALVSLSNRLQFSVNRSCTSFIKCISQYFMFI